MSLGTRGWKRGLPFAFATLAAVANPTGANAIPIRIHPMMPVGTIYFHLKTNPYPHSRIPVNTSLRWRGHSRPIIWFRHVVSW